MRRANDSKGRHRTRPQHYLREHVTWVRPRHDRAMRCGHSTARARGRTRFRDERGELVFALPAVAQQHGHRLLQQRAAAAAHVVHREDLAHRVRDLALQELPALHVRRHRHARREEGLHELRLRELRQRGAAYHVPAAGRVLRGGRGGAARRAAGRGRTSAALLLTTTQVRQQQLLLPLLVGVWPRSEACSPLAALACVRGSQ